jgi:hypothetical protein
MDCIVRLKTAEIQQFICNLALAEIAAVAYLGACIACDESHLRARMKQIVSTIT